MQDLPHLYRIDAAAKPDTTVTLSGTTVPTLESAPPLQFGGPGDKWSPEDLLVAAIADCFILSFKAISRASKFEWENLSCSVEGTLDRVDRVTQFTAFTVQANLSIAATADAEKAHKLLEKAEHACLVSNSLKAPVQLQANIHQAT